MLHRQSRIHNHQMRVERSCFHQTNFAVGGGPDFVTHPFQQASQRLLSPEFRVQQQNFFTLFPEDKERTVSTNTEPMTGLVR